MALHKQKFREIVLQILYALNVVEDGSAELVPFLMKEHKITRKITQEALLRAQEIALKLSEIDERISSLSHEYSFERIGSVERTILRLGAYELLFDESIPPKVVIAEAIRLCRKFGSHESARFVNAILDSLYKAHESRDTALSQ